MSLYACDSCAEYTPEGDGLLYKGQRLCPDCAEVIAFWETIEHDDDSEVTA